MSWSGLLYLAFFFCSKFAITIPFLQLRKFSGKDSSTFAHIEDSILPLHHQKDHSSTSRTTDTMLQGSSSPNVPLRNQAAAPPNYLLALPLVPICLAIYITATRYFQFYHHGFDIMFGSLIGISSAWFSFRWYHLPIRQGAGWSWGARSRDRAFAIGVGRGNYVGSEGWSSKKGDARTTETNGRGSVDPVLSPGLDGAAEERGVREGESVDATII